MHHHIKITILNEKINKNTIKNNLDSITYTKNKKKLHQKLVLVVFMSSSSLLPDYTPLRHESLQRLLLKPCLNLKIPIGTVGGTTPQPQNHYWYFWFVSSTSESLLAMWQIIPQPQNLLLALLACNSIDGVTKITTASRKTSDQDVTGIGFTAAKTDTASKGCREKRCKNLNVTSSS
jgi:hypothetical protein